MADPNHAIDFDRLADLAVRVARSAGDLLLDAVEQVRATVATKSTPTDMVTEMDHAAERAVVDGIRAERPDDGVMGEEGTTRTGATGVRWVIDPLDGTTNFLYRFPAWAVSVAAQLDGESVAGAVHDPVHGETYRAVRGRGATRNGVALQVEGAPRLDTALVATGFSYDPVVRREQAATLAGIIGSVRDVRRAGSAALDLCWVASGRLDLYYEHGLQPWDWSAGALIAAEAGAIVGDLDGAAPSSQLVVAAPPQLDEPFRALLRANVGQ